MDRQLETYEVKKAVVVEPARIWQKVGGEPVYYPDNEEGVTIPIWAFAGFIGLMSGMILGPAIMATTKGGSEKLAELSRRYVAGR